MSSEPTDGWTTRMPDDHCPHCGHEIRYATAAGHYRPKPGDLSVAFCCGTLLRIRPNMRVQTLTDVEFLALPLDTRRELCLVRRRILDHNAGHHSV